MKKKQDQVSFYAYTKGGGIHAMKIREPITLRGRDFTKRILTPYSD